jgi:HPt (histidine-containing phosphotransfer) domain-containing protein
VRARYEQALEARHPESTKLRALMGFAAEKADEHRDYAGAIKALEMLDKVLSVPVPPKDGRAGAPAPDAAAADRFAARLKALLTTAKSLAGPAGAAALSGITQQAASAQGAARLGELDRANELLDALEKALGDLTTTTSVRTPGMAASAAGAADEARIRERLAGLDARIEAVHAGGGRPASELRVLQQMLDGQLGAGELERGGLVLDRIERLLAETEREQALFRRRVAEVADAVAQAEREASAQLATLESALQRSDDAELKLIGDAGLRWILGDHGQRVAAAVGVVAQAAHGGPPARRRSGRLGRGRLSRPPESDEVPPATATTSASTCRFQATLAFTDASASCWTRSGRRTRRTRDATRTRRDGLDRTEGVRRWARASESRRSFSGHPVVQKCDARAWCRGRLRRFAAGGRSELKDARTRSSRSRPAT